MTETTSRIPNQDIRHTDPFSSESLQMSQRFITSDAERDAMNEEIQHLSSQGFVILQNQISAETLERMREALDRINADTRWGISEFEGYQTHRAYCVVGKTDAFDELVMNRAVLAVIEGYFGETPQLSASMGMTLYEGQKAQPLHRDTGHYTLPWPRPPLEVNSIWAFDDFRRDNGATCYLPGTHRTPDEDRPEGDPVAAEMSAGSVLIYDGSLWHGGGESIAEGARRRSVNNIFARPWLRQQDNMYLTLGSERVLSADKVMQRLLGYWIHGATLGVVDGEAPLKVMAERQRTS